MPTPTTGFPAIAAAMTVPIASMDDGKIGHLIDLDRRDPVRDENVRRNTDSGDVPKLKLHRSDHAIRPSFEALNDFGNDLRRAGASHGEVDQQACPSELRRSPVAGEIRPAE